VSLHLPHLRAWLCTALLCTLCGVGHADALDDAMNARGRGDYAAALVQFRQLAHAGNAAAAFQLSLLYANGLGVRADVRESVRWLRTAAARGDGQAQTNLGIAHAKGRGVVQDDSRAYVWFALAAAGGDAVALTNRDLAARKLNAQQMKQATALLAQCQGPHLDVCL
jgi:TPR repeat protein